MQSLSQQVGSAESTRNSTVSDVSSGGGSSNDLLVNALVYQQPKALSLATSRSFVRQQFQQQTYSGSPSTTMISRDVLRQCRE